MKFGAFNILILAFILAPARADGRDGAVAAIILRFDHVGDERRRRPESVGDGVMTRRRLAGGARLERDVARVVLVVVVHPRLGGGVRRGPRGVLLLGLRSVLHGELVVDSPLLPGGGVHRRGVAPRGSEMVCLGSSHPPVVVVCGGGRLRRHGHGGRADHGRGQHGPSSVVVRERVPRGAAEALGQAQRDVLELTDNVHEPPPYLAPQTLALDPLCHLPRREPLHVVRALVRVTASRRVDADGAIRVCQGVDATGAISSARCRCAGSAVGDALGRQRCLQERQEDVMRVLRLKDELKVPP
mmetsp:Transcript_49904/g.150061  ORF Transcript_49904/g.150061 Transcript_49904/m.150061 type:complete len:300 (-) Transcript_49904:1439-2338(-)